MKNKYFTKALIIGLISGFVIASACLGYLYYVSKKTVEQINSTKNLENLNLDLKDLDGKPIDMKQFADKTVLVNFWATWCSPCLHEMPILQKVYKEKKDSYVFIVIADEAEGLKKIKEFKEKYGYDFVFATTTHLNKKISGYPTTFILDKSQNVKYRQFGGFENEKDFLNFLNKK